MSLCKYSCAHLKIVWFMFTPVNTLRSRVQLILKLQENNLDCWIFLFLTLHVIHTFKDTFAIGNQDVLWVFADTASLNRIVQHEGSVRTEPCWQAVQSDTDFTRSDIYAIWFPDRHLFVDSAFKIRVLLCYFALF